MVSICWRTHSRPRLIAKMWRKKFMHIHAYIHHRIQTGKDRTWCSVFSHCTLIAYGILSLHTVYHHALWIYAFFASSLTCFVFNCSFSSLFYSRGECVACSRPRLLFFFSSTFCCCFCRCHRHFNVLIIEMFSFTFLFFFFLLSTSIKKLLCTKNEIRIHCSAYASKKFPKIY